MAYFQAALFLFFGIGLGLMLWQSLHKGWLPFGPNGFRGRLEISRDRLPSLYWLLFVLYAGGATALVGYALRLLSGDAEPLPLQ